MNTHRTHAVPGVYIVALLTFVSAVLAFPAYAHDGEDHSADTVVAVTLGTTEVEKLEAMVKVLQKLVTLLTEYKKLYGTLPVSTTYTPTETAPVPPPAPGIPVTVDEHVAHDDHDSEVPLTPAPRLLIELETHDGKTHVHVRYTDKPEDMFFADAPLTDERGIIDAIIARTGMTKEVIQPALKYIE